MCLIFPVSTILSFHDKKSINFNIKIWGEITTKIKLLKTCRKIFFRFLFTDVLIEYKICRKFQHARFANL